MSSIVAMEHPSVDTNPHKLAAYGNLAALESFLESEHKTLSKEELLNQVDATGCTPLLWSARNGCLDVFQYLIVQGSNAESAGFGGLRCLHHAVHHTHSSILKILLSDVRVDIHARDDMGNEAVHYAAACGILVPLNMLLDAGADVNVVNNQQTSPLLRAANNGHATVLRKLLQHQAKINHVDALGNTALHLATKGGHLEVVKTLLEFEAKTNVKNKLGQVPADVATVPSLIQLLA